MVVKFGKEYLRELSHCRTLQILKPYTLCIRSITKSWLEIRLVISSIRIDNQYRLEFAVDMDSAEPTITICTLEDITNHYK